MIPSDQSQKDDLIADLKNDIACSLRQAENGPFYPERGITAQSLRMWAKSYQEEIDRLIAGSLTVEQFIKGS